MIYGIGTDIVAVSRITALHERYGDALARRILTTQEWAAYATHAQPVRFLAKRFAAKEAFAKAVGTGIREPVSLRFIGVAHDEWGKPTFACAPELVEWLAQRGIARVHLSLSDEKEQVIAFALAEAG